MKIISDETKTKILNITEGIFAISFNSVILFAIYSAFNNISMSSSGYEIHKYIMNGILAIMLVSGIIYFPMNYFWRLNK